MDVLHQKRLLYGGGGESAHWIHDKNHSSTRAATLLLSLWGLQVERELDDAQTRASQFGSVRERGDNCQCVHNKNKSIILFTLRLEPLWRPRNSELCGRPLSRVPDVRHARVTTPHRCTLIGHCFSRVFPFPTTFPYYLHCKLVFLSDVRMYPRSAAKFTRSRDRPPPGFKRLFKASQETNARSLEVSASEQMSSERHSVVDPNPFKQAATNSG